jgi:predicted signal transduction protein with EAL and GGDEF domain
MRAMPVTLDPALLPEIDAALVHSGWMPSIPRPLLPAFRSSGEASRRANNRYVMLLLTVMFDLYWLPQHQFAPDIVHLSGLLRFAFFTPAALIFCVLELIQLETRNRQVFLLTFNERIRRAMVAEQNSGLLQETQTDALTQLANRRCFDETLLHEWLGALTAGIPLYLIMIDIDHFKAFNDHYGHVMGDDCLRKVAAVLRAETRPVDLVAAMVARNSP